MRARGVLLLNVGSPESQGLAPDGRVLPPGVAEVREYLREFLMDPRVIDIPWVARWLLVNGVILQSRPAASRELYRRIWTDQGSPLLVHSRTFAEKIKAKLGGGYVIGLAMRYGKPGIFEAVQALREKDVSELTVLPLYPQFSEATTGSAMEAVKNALAELKWPISVREIPPFYRDGGFLRAFSSRIEAFAPRTWDKVLFSFHGLPESHIVKSAAVRGHCLSSECCAKVETRNSNCYRAQCFETARLLAAGCELSEGAWTVGFQSRLGRARWIMPSTETVLDELARTGKTRVLVACPSFVADCLETLEEIGIRARDRFIRSGGKELQLVPSMNAEDAWVEAVAAWFGERQTEASPSVERLAEEVT